METDGQTVFRFTSPALKEKDRVLSECPVSAVLREMPYAYKLVNAHAYSKQSGIKLLDMPKYIQDAFGVMSSEKARLDEMAEQDRQTKRDASYGKRALMRR